MTLEIFADDLHEGRWFASLSPRLSNVKIKPIAKRRSNPPYVERLLRYDRPDIILVSEGEPRLVVEKTREVPTGHNVGQRFARFANAVEEKVMVVFFLPFKAMKHGSYAGICYIPARLFLALEKMEEIHGIPVLAINWPCDKDGELIGDGSQDADMRRLVHELIQSEFDYGNEVIKELRQTMRRSRNERIREQPDTAEPPPTVKFIDTEGYIGQLRGQFGNEINVVPDSFHRRPRTLIYQLGMTPAKCRREDPYTGTQFIYDYIWCRNGPHPSEKHTNLVLAVPLVSKRRWIEANPNDPTRKSAVYYATANLIILKDGLIACNTLVGPRSTSILGLNRFIKG
ncbi:MAG: hypothetical protein QXG05_02405 [Nitrososphaerota archaeon]